MKYFIKLFHKSHLTQLFSLLLLFAFHQPLIAMDDTIPELEKSVNSMPDDTAKVNTLILLGEKLCSIKNDKALMFLQEAFTISTAQDYTSGIGRSLLWQGRVYYYKDDYPLSNNYLDKAVKYLQEPSSKNDLAFLYFAKGENYRINGDYIRALESYKKALELAEQTGNQKYKSTFYGSIGRVQLHRDEPELALIYMKEALKQKKLINDQSGVSNNYTCIGMAYEALDMLDSALWYHDQALRIRESLNNERAMAGSEYNKAGILIKMKLYEEAEKSLVISLKYFTKFEEKTGIIITNLSLAMARNFLNEGDAVELANSALKMAKEINNPRLISHSYEVLSGIYDFRGDYKLAYDYLELHKSLDDSIFSTDKERILTEFEQKFQSERKDREIEFYKVRNQAQRQNNILLVILLVVSLAIVVLLFFLFRMKSAAFKRQQKMIDQEQIIHLQANQIAEKEKQLLQEQLETKNRELASKALEMIRLNDTITHIIEKLETFNHSVNNNPDATKNIKDIIHDLETQTKQNIWNEFDKIFKNIHSDFYSKLLQICPDLTATEIKTAALLKLNLTTKEIAALTFKSEGGIKTTRYRLRKKLNLANDDKLVPFLMQI